MKRTRVGILISGRGSNMRALIDACAAPDYPAEVGLVLSSDANAEGLMVANSFGIRTAVVSHYDYKRQGFSREAFDLAMQQLLALENIEFVCLAGFMRILSDGFVRKWRGRILNIHPSLLPAFRGLRPQQQALEAGAKVSGCTVHFVVPELDAGPIVAQTQVDIQPGDTVETLSARILEAEHATYPAALKKVLQQSNAV